MQRRQRGDISGTWPTRTRRRFRCFTDDMLALVLIAALFVWGTSGVCKRILSEAGTGNVTLWGALHVSLEFIAVFLPAHFLPVLGVCLGLQGELCLLPSTEELSRQNFRAFLL